MPDLLYSIIAANHSPDDDVLAICRTVRRVMPADSRRDPQKRTVRRVIWSQAIRFHRQRTDA